MRRRNVFQYKEDPFSKSAGGIGKTYKWLQNNSKYWFWRNIKRFIQIKKIKKEKKNVLFGKYNVVKKNLDFEEN